MRGNVCAISPLRAIVGHPLPFVALALAEHHSVAIVIQVWYSDGHNLHAWLKCIWCVGRHEQQVAIGFQLCSGQVFFATRGIGQPNAVEQNGAATSVIKLYK